MDTLVIPIRINGTVHSIDIYLDPPLYGNNWDELPKTGQIIVARTIDNIFIGKVLRIINDCEIWFEKNYYTYHIESDIWAQSNCQAYISRDQPFKVLRFPKKK